MSKNKQNKAGMETVDNARFKKLLEAEYMKVENELKTVGRKNSSAPGEWEATSDATDVDTADENLVADSMDTYESNTLVLRQLEIRWNEIKAALESIKNGSYGVCQECGNLIELERLEANPAATTCEKHMGSSSL